MIVRDRLQPPLDETQGLVGALRLQQGFGVSIDQRPIAGIGFQRLAEAREGSFRTIGRQPELARQRVDDGVGRHLLAQQFQLLARARVIPRAQQAGDQAVAAGLLAQELALDQALLEILDRLARRIELGTELRADQLEIEAVRNLAVSHPLRAVLDVGDALIGERVRAQVGRRAAFVDARRALHPLEKARHGVRVETRLVEYQQPDAVRVALVLAGEVELALNRAGLPERQRGPRGVAAHAREQQGRGH